MIGQTGADTVLGGVGEDTLLGYAGTDRLEGGAGNDRMKGHADADSLAGGEGDDTLQGGPGADTMRGGLGADRLRSEPDGVADVFVWAAGEGGDRVQGFIPGQDRLLLEGLGPLDPARFIAGQNPAAPGGTGAYVLYDAATGRLSVDWDGPGGDAIEFIAAFVGRPALSAADLL